MTGARAGQAPNLVIAGVVKGGTTSVFSYLARHPEVCASSIKETCHFLPYRYREPEPPPAPYLEYFAHCGSESYRMEATPGYFEGGRRVGEQILRVNGEQVRVLIVLRKPVSRFLSFFKFKKSMLELPRELAIGDYIRACQEMEFEQRRQRENDTWWGLDGGLYADYLPDWLSLFGERLQVLFFDDLQRDSSAFMQQLCAWLELDPAIYTEGALGVENRSVGYRNRTLQGVALGVNHGLERFWRAHPGIKQRLREFYYRLNGQPHAEVLDPQSRAFLNQFYADSNRRLAAQLRAAGYCGLPDWMPPQGD